MELHPQQVITKQLQGKDNVYPLVVSIEPESYTNIQKHSNEGLFYGFNFGSNLLVHNKSNEFISGV